MKNPTHLQVTITIPEGMSDEQVCALITELSLKLNEAHRDLGGKGLHVVSVEVMYDSNKKI